MCNITNIDSSHVTAGALLSNISDHFPIFEFVETLLAKKVASISHKFKQITDPTLIAYRQDICKMHAAFSGVPRKTPNLGTFLRFCFLIGPVVSSTASSSS